MQKAKTVALICYEKSLLQDVAILMYKVKYGLAPSIVDELFKQKSTSYSLRNSNFDIPTFNTINYEKHSLRSS